jgi:Na+/melibiose symporter-like transporter
MDRLPALRLAAYAAPAAALAALLLPMHVHLAPFYAEMRGLDLAALGTVLIAVRLFDAATDPLMGWLSDRWRLPFGRRRGWILAAVPVIVLAAWALMRPPEGAGIVWFGAFMALMTLGWTMASVPYLALGAELTPDYAERARVTVWRESVGLGGTIAVLVLVDRAGLGSVAIAVAIVLPLAVALLLARVPEPVAPRHPGPSLAAMVAVMARDRVFLRLLFAYLLNGAANGFPPALFLFYVGAVIGADATAAGAILLLYFLAAILGGTLWSRGARRWPKHRLWCIAMILASAAFLPAALLGPGDLWTFVAISAVTGVFFGADLALPPAIQADVVDRETARSGRASTGSFFALWAVAAKAALALSGGIAFIVLGAAGFVAGGESPPGALSALAWLYAGAPVLLKLAAVTVMWNFPLDRAEQEALRLRIAAVSR